MDDQAVSLPVLHPVDELVKVRAEIRALKERENALREKIIETGGLIGRNHIAFLIHSDREQWDHEALKEELGMAQLRPFVRKTTVIRVRTKEL